MAPASKNVKKTNGSQSVKKIGPDKELQGAASKENVKQVDNLRTLNEKVEKEKKKNQKLRAQIRDLKLSNNKTVEKITEDAEKTMVNVRKEMLKMQALLSKGQEQRMMEVKPWKICEICTEEFTEQKEHSPRVMKCGHTYCYSCISQLHVNWGMNMKCPADRQRLKLSGRAIDNLPINYLALHM